MSRHDAGTRSAAFGKWKPEALADCGETIVPVRVAAYIRVSTDSEDQENSYEAQEKYYSAILQGNPMLENAGIYFDRGITGTSLIHRTGFKRLLRHCEEGKIDRIICKSISRFARNTKDFVETLRRLKKFGVTVYFETPGFDTADGATDFVLTTLAAIAQEESWSISQNVRDGLEHHYRMGEVRNCDIYGYRYNGGTVVAESGYRYRDIEIAEKEAVIVRRIFHCVAGGKTFAEIARELNREGVPAADRCRRAGADEGWTGAMISRLVRNERYCGDVVVRKTYTRDYLTHKGRRNQGEKGQYRIKDHHAPIISRELFEKVQEDIKGNIRGVSGGGRQYRPLSGILACGECGRKFHVRSTARDIIWFCPTAERRNGKCVCHVQKRRESQIRQMVQAVVEKRQIQEGEKHCPGLPDTGTFRLLTGSGAGASGIVEKAQFVFEILARMRIILEDDGLERRYAELKRLQTGSGNIGRTEQAFSESGGAEIAEQLAALENARAEAETFREYREKAIDWMQALPGGETRWREFLDGVSGEHLKAFFVRITVKPEDGYVFRWFDGAETEVAVSDAAARNVL